MAPEAATLEERAAEVRSALEENGDKLRELRTLPEADRGDTYSADLQNAVHAIRSLDAELTAVERSVEGRTALTVGPLAATQAREAGVRTAGMEVAENEAFMEWAQRNRGSGISPDVEIRTLITTSREDTSSGGLFAPVGQPFLPSQTIQRRRMFLRDLIPVTGTGLGLIPYFKELDPRSLEGGASAVDEGAAKPEVTMKFEDADAPVRKIAAWIPVTTEILADAPSLRGYIDARLGYMLQVREEQMLLNGNGSAPQLRGILQTTGRQTQNAVSGDFAVTLANSIAKLEAIDAFADGIVMNPLDYWTMITDRQSDGHFDHGGPFAGTPGNVWDTPIVRTSAITVGKAIVGAWALAAQIFDREQTVIRVGDQHADYFTNNKVAILAEERLAFAVYRPDFFVETTLA